MAQSLLDKALSHHRQASLRHSLAATQWGRELANGNRLFNMSDAQALALHAYTHESGEGSYGPVNDALRSGTISPELSALVKLQRLALKKAPAVAAEVRRFIDRIPGDLIAAAPGDEWMEKGFFSTSLRAALLSPVFGQMPHQMIVVRHRNGRDISALSAHPLEAEVLFSPRTRFRIISRVEVNGDVEFGFDEV